MPSSSSLHYRSSPRRRKSSSRDSSPERKRRHGTSSSTTTKHGSGKKHRATDANKESKCATIKRLTQQSGPCRKIIESHARSNTLPFYDLATYVLDLHDKQSVQQMQHTAIYAPQFRSAHPTNMQSNMMVPNTMMRGPLATNTGNNQQQDPVVENSRFAADGSQRGIFGRMWYKGKRLVRNHYEKLMIAAIVAACAYFGPAYVLGQFGYTAMNGAVLPWIYANLMTGMQIKFVYETVKRMMPSSPEVQAADAEIERQSRKPGAISGGGKTSTKKKAVAKVKSTHSMVLRPRRQHSY